MIDRCKSSDWYKMIELSNSRQHFNLFLTISMTKMVGKLAILLLSAAVCCQGFESPSTRIDNPPKAGPSSFLEKPFRDVQEQVNNVINGIGKFIRPQNERFFTRISSQGQELANLINQYRSENGLPAVPISKSLTQVAEAHVMDSHNPRESQCNLHSWSSNGPWTACCYTADHAQAQCMWNKPREIAQFPGNGYEISAWSTSLTPNQALDMWKGSPGHNDVILNKGTWEGWKWQSMGVGIDGNYAHVWFSDVADSK